MAQFLRPNSDISTGGWAAAPLYQRIDEETYNDADYIYSSTDPTTCRIGLSTGSTPASKTNHVFRYRARAGTTSPIRNLTASLYQDTTAIAGNTHQIVNSFNTYSINLTEAQANNITDYSALEIRFTWSGSGTNHVLVSWAELEIPDAGIQGALSKTLGNISVTAEAQVTIAGVLSKALEGLEIISAGKISRRKYGPAIQM